MQGGLVSFGIYPNQLIFPPLVQRASQKGFTVKHRNIHQLLWKAHSLKEVSFKLFVIANVALNINRIPNL
jgi:hypothetical protein